MMKRIRILEQHCVGCGLCEVHCVVQHSRSGKIIKAYRDQRDEIVAAVQVERSGYESFALQCRHCEDPLCIEACMTGALYRDPETDAVLCDSERCVGCWMCIMICPAGAIQRVPDGSAATKCDLCAGRDVPVCVENCPNEALVVEDEE